MNSIIITGRLTRDPESKTTGNGIEYCNFTVACDRAFKNKDGQRETDFLNCVSWRQQSAFVCKYFHKGDAILVRGSLETRKYEDSDGKKQTFYDIKADQVEFFSAKKSDGSGRSDSPPPEPTSYDPRDTQAHGAGVDEIDDDELPF